MSTTMGIKAQELGLDLGGMTVSVQRKCQGRAAAHRCPPSEVHIPLPPDSPHRGCLEQRPSIARCTKVCP
ncbi:MAG: hypothetical protein Udaeo2_02410 [Candidatus Udaeobacter sp.]|nr:MAG: hypothetical protein Udaeo2_02410 [Candidatus Udaeobacter sp.]